MKKFAILGLALCLSAAMLVGCGCMNTDTDVPTLPTNGETATPTRPETTAPTTAVTTAPTTMPTTGATEAPTDTTGPLEGAMDDILGGSTDDAGTVPPEGRRRGNGPMMPRK